MRTKTLGLMFALLLLVSVTTSASSKIIQGIQQIQQTLCQILPVLVMLLVVFAAVIYAAGQMGSADTRGRATVWATNLLIGAILGIVIYLLLPAVLNALWTGPDQQINC